MNRYRKNEHVVNYLLIGLNVLYFIFLSFMGDTETDLDMMIRFGAMFEPLVIENKEYYRMFTSCFMHFGIEHLINNMLVLLIIGDNLERALGHIKYLILYIAAGIAGNLLSLYFNILTGSFVVSAGASGAVFGVSGALLWILLRNKGRLEDLSFNRIALMVGMNIYIGMTSTGIDNAAHIGGLIAGFIIAVLFYRKKSRRSRGEWDYM